MTQFSSLPSCFPVAFTVQPHPGLVLLFQPFARHLDHVHSAVLTQLFSFEESICAVCQPSSTGCETYAEST